MAYKLLINGLGLSFDIKLISMSETYYIDCGNDLTEVDAGIIQSYIYYIGKKLDKIGKESLAEVEWPLVACHSLTEILAEEISDLSLIAN